MQIATVSPLTSDRDIKMSVYQTDGNEIFIVTNKEITVQVGVNNNSNCGNFRCIAENGLTPSDEYMVKINQVSKLYKSNTTIILGQRPTSSKLFELQSRTLQNSSSIHRQVSGFVLA